ncbi:enoyl-CoA hydratase/isomerase family protein [Nocardioides sp. W7]|uniref:enoyl-CoA hydratase/isomerase family protein n=1 Tax=Nocardioides sp. W7 TaxID=2931390 RepID=UPI001FD059F7|nr:enoyl-CoA hydratase/isomerase family protein [Nocardioides sp. W7]
MATTVTLEVNDGVAVVTLDGPDRLNVFTAGTGRELSAAYQACESDDDVRVIVLTGAGRAFCAGADLSPEARSFAAPGSEFSASPVRPPAFELSKLVVAAVNGHAIGIGLTIALQADVRIVAEDAKLAVPQVRFGLVGDAQSHWTLRRLAGTAVAADLLLTGRTITGREAAERGIASFARPAAQVLPAALELAREVAAAADPLAVAASKRILWGELSASETERAETEAHRRLMGR